MSKAGYTPRNQRARNQVVGPIFVQAAPNTRTSTATTKHSQHHHHHVSHVNHYQQEQRQQLQLQPLHRHNHQLDVEPVLCQPSNWSSGAAPLTPAESVDPTALPPAARKLYDNDGSRVFFAPPTAGGLRPNKAQLVVLHQIYEKNPSPSHEMIKAVADRLSMKKSTSKRAKDRKKEIEDFSRLDDPSDLVLNPRSAQMWDSCSLEYHEQRRQQDLIQHPDQVSYYPQYSHQYQNQQNPHLNTHSHFNQFEKAPQNVYHQGRLEEQQKQQQQHLRQYQQQRQQTLHYQSDEMSEFSYPRDNLYGNSDISSADQFSVFGVLNNPEEETKKISISSLIL
ncbi:hypothetical protein HK100_000524 [Physocladia obscura]|uniref:Uncharacterized protein n=1 Tax=Physocladia obscura TaxID=109957 RepID=A0AAD5XGW6_9FUNG|nr:hypothetical protein HK100_000524 [Physocladia obscura]